MSLLDLSAAIVLVAGGVNFVTRPLVISLLHRIGKFESLGAPRALFMTDALPARTILIPLASAPDKALAVIYFVSWALLLASLPVCVISLLVQ
jgi:hypothetical protein